MARRKQQAPGERRPAMAVPAELLSASLREVILHGETFVAAFYERLFSRFPETRALFANTAMSEQRKKLQQSLVLIIEHMHQPDLLSEHLRELGHRHTTYGVRPEHYALVGTVLQEVFADFLDESWTQAHQQAWTEVYEAVSRLMMEGAQET
jgi:hemoglobin-like flavoprotein